MLVSAPIWPSQEAVSPGIMSLGPQGSIGATASSSSKFWGPEGFQVGCWPRWDRLSRLIARVLRDDKRLSPLTLECPLPQVLVFHNLESPWSSSPLSIQECQRAQNECGLEGGLSTESWRSGRCGCPLGALPALGNQMGS